MQVQIDLSDRLAAALENRARQFHSSVQAVAIEAIEKELATVASDRPGGQRVRLPQIHSAKPGSLRSLTNAEIDDILD